MKSESLCVYAYIFWYLVIIDEHNFVLRFNGLKQNGFFPASLFYWRIRHAPHFFYRHRFLFIVYCHSIVVCMCPLFDSFHTMFIGKRICRRKNKCQFKISSSHSPICIDSWISHYKIRNLFSNWVVIWHKVNTIIKYKTQK